MVDQRSVGDCFIKLDKNHKRKMAAEERASGIDPTHTEMDEALQDIARGKSLQKSRTPSKKIPKNLQKSLKISKIPEILKNL